MLPPRITKQTLWRSMIFLGVLLLVITFMVSEEPTVEANSNFFAAFQSTYPATSGTNLDSCTVCHTSIPNLNPYGVDYKNNGFNFAAIELLDSDGDGFTNIAEINALTMPGNASSVPTVPPTATTAPTNTPIAPTNTPIAPTNTPIGPTNTPIAPTNTPIGPTNTPIAPTNTPITTATATNTPVSTATANPTTQPGSEVEFEGFVESIGATRWTIAGKVVRVDANTEIDEEDGPAVVGAYVEVNAIGERDGGLYAKEIEVEDEVRTPEPSETPDAPETPEPTETPEEPETPEPTQTPESTPIATSPGTKLEFRGRIEAITTSEWMISGRSVMVDANTEIEEEDGPAVVGATVEVKALRWPDGRLYAQVIEIKDSHDDEHEIEFKGYIESMAAPAWLIDNRTVLVDSDTVIDTRHGPAVIGTYVAVKAILQVDGTLLALRIKVEDEHSDDDSLPEVEFEGVLEVMGTDAWIIAGRQVIVDARSELEERNGPFVIGAYVDVKARRQNDGGLWAERIRTSKPEDSGLPTFEWEGYIEDMGDTSWTVSGEVVFIDPSTSIDTLEGPAIIGAAAKVYAYQVADGSLHAHRIRIRNRVPDGFKIEFRGPITAMSATEWVVADRPLIIDVNTEFTNLQRARLGNIAEVKARRTQDSSLVAITIHIEGSGADMVSEFEWKGRIKALEPSQWIVGGRVVRISADTQIQGQPRIGALVEVHARRQNGVLIAIQLHIEDEGKEAEWQGMVAEITPSQWTVGDRVVQVDGRTVYDERHGPLGIGVLVSVKAQQQTDGTWLALRIKTED